jgi:hypothetical protein
MVKNKANSSLNSRNVKDSADSPNLSAMGLSSSGSSRLSPYQISHRESKGLDTRYPDSATSGGPEVDTTSPPEAVLLSMKPDILASAPDEDLKYACKGIRSESSLSISASASLGEIWATFASLLYDADARVVQSSGQNEPLNT